MTTDTLMSQVLEVHGADALIGPAPLAYVNRQGDAFLMAGGHTGWAWCWCQPKVNMVPTACPHGEHPQVTHRRTADGVTDMPGAGWDTDEDDGSVYPAGQEPES